MNKRLEELLTRRASPYKFDWQVRESLASELEARCDVLRRRLAEAHEVVSALSSDLAETESDLRELDSRGWRVKK